MLALVTGAAGFVGRHMMIELQARGWETVGVDLYRSDEYPCIVADARKIFSVRSTFMSGRDDTIAELSMKRFDLVVHCAYHVGGRAAIDGNPSLLALNLELDAQMFNWAVRTRQRAVMYFSSSAAYPTGLQQAGSTSRLSENLIGNLLLGTGWQIQPDARYGWAKLTGEYLAAAAASEGVRVHVLRPFSGYGEDQDLTYPFPAILRRVLDGDLSVWGPPGQVRDWIHIDDVVRGAMAVYQADYRKPINLCTGVGTEFGQLATQIAQHAGIQPGPVTYNTDMPTGVMVRVGDPTRMLSLYTPKISIDSGIRRALKELDR